MNKNAQLYYQSALKLSLPATLIPDIAGFKIQLGKKKYFFRNANTPFNNYSSASILENKFCTKSLWSEAGIPVPKGLPIHKIQKAFIKNIIKNLRPPYVVKPMFGGKGKDVLCNVVEVEDISAHLDVCFATNDYVLIEEFQANLRNYRILIFQGRILDIVERFPATIVGDGIHSIEQLIVKTNQERDTGPAYFTPILIDKEVQLRLTELKLTLEDVPKAGELLTLGYTCNGSRGGSIQAFHGSICKENEQMCLKAAEALGITLVGLDIVCEDISTPFSQSKVYFIEANHNPSLRIHEERPEPKAVSIIILRALWKKHYFRYWWYKLLRRPYK